jgi:hypothetical protein
MLDSVMAGISRSSQGMSQAERMGPDTQHSVPRAQRDKAAIKLLTIRDRKQGRRNTGDFSSLFVPRVVSLYKMAVDDAISDQCVQVSRHDQHF